MIIEFCVEGELYWFKNIFEISFFFYCCCYPLACSAGASLQLVPFMLLIYKLLQACRLQIGASGVYIDSYTFSFSGLLRSARNDALGVILQDFRDYQDKNLDNLFNLIKIPVQTRFYSATHLTANPLDLTASLLVNCLALLKSRQHPLTIKFTVLLLQ